MTRSKIVLIMERSQTRLNRRKSRILRSRWIISRATDVNLGNVSPFLTASQQWLRHKNVKKLSE